MAWDDSLTDGVDTINASRWNSMVTDQKNRSLSSHTHNEFALFPYNDYWYIYTDGTTYYAKNMKTSGIDYSGADFPTVIDSVVASGITNTGFIKLGTGVYPIPAASNGIQFGDKSIIVEGSGWGRGTIPNNPGTLIKGDATITAYLLQFGLHGTYVEGAGIRNCAIMNYPGNTACLGGVDLYNTINSFVEHCYVYGFEQGASPMNAISIRGATDETQGGWCNRAVFNHIKNPDNGILLGANANYCVIEGNLIEGSANTVACGIKCDGTGAPIASPYACYIAGNRIRNFGYQTTSIGLYVTNGCNNSGRHTIIGNSFQLNSVNIKILGGTGIGECTLVGNDLQAASSTQLSDTGDIKSYRYNNKNYVTEMWGATASVVDGGTVSHGLSSTPTTVVATGSVANEVITVTALGTTTFTVAIKKFTPGSPGSWGPGTTQTIYWRAWMA